jgi:PAS domain S-box-containing protein
MLAHPLLRHFAITVSLTLAAVFLTLLFWPLCQWYPAVFFLIAVLAGAWRWRLWQGISTASAALLALLFVYRNSGGDAGPMAWSEVAWRLGLFAMVGGLASYLTHLCRQALSAVTRFHGTLAAVDDALIFTDEFGKVRQLNTVAETLTGFKSGDAVGQPLERIFKCVQGDERKPFALPIAKITGEQATIDLPVSARLANDLAREVCIEGRAAPHRDDHDGPIGIALVFRDVTSRQQEARECRKREEQFRTLAGCAPVSLLFLEPQGRCVFANAAWQTASGLTSDECQGDGWAKALHPDDRGRLVTEWQHALRAGREFCGECRLQPRRGETRWLRLSSAPMLSERGQLLGHVGVLEDHDAQRQAEAALRASENRFTAVMKNFPGLAFLKDAKGRYIYANDAYARVFDLEPGDCDGKTDAELLEDQENPFCSHVEHVREYQDDRESVEELEGKGTFLVHQFAVPAEKSGEILFGVLALDISAQRGAEQALRAAREEFERKWNERAGDLKRSEEALKKARADLEKHLSDCNARQKQAEEALRAARQELDPLRRQLEENAAARRKSEEALKAATELLDEQGEEHKAALQALRTQFDERTLELEQLREQLAGNEESATRLAALEAENRELTEEIARAEQEYEEELGKLAEDQDKLTKENESLQEQLAAFHEHDRPTKSRPTAAAQTAVASEAAAEPETHQILVHSWRLVENMESWRARDLPADWLSYN